MSTKKTIQINPELFRVPGTKTRKNREKKELTISPVITPNNLKNKLLRRIKEHKAREILANEPRKNVAAVNTNTNTNMDEFSGAMSYLSDITKKQRLQRELHNRTIKHKPIDSIVTNHNISLELPAELSETFYPSTTNDVFNVNYRVDDTVPYGCLKNGKKKTYREWKELTKEPDIPDLVRPPTPPKKRPNVLLEGATIIANPSPKLATRNNLVPSQNQLQNQLASISREERLEQIKNKLKRIQEQEMSDKERTLRELNKVEEEINKKYAQPTLDLLPDFDKTTTVYPDISELLKEKQEMESKQTPKTYIKKTVKRKFTLGRSDKSRHVSVLIKDRQTRKNIINVQKELKKKDITDVRKYLRQHGILKVGSTCPPDIIRKMFESALMAGEITNINKETLLHNFLHSETGTASLK
jgi:hypothetical protein